MTLVTGATGKVGVELVKELQRRGAAFRAFVRDADKARGELGPDVELAVGDLDRPETLGAALEGADRLFLLTAPSQVQVAQETAATDAAKRAGVRHVVKLSVIGADEQSRLGLARAHRAAERVLETSGLDYTLLRPTFFMQNLLGMVNEGVVAGAAGEGKLAMVDARDIAAVAAAALAEDGHEGKTYVVTGPEALTFAEAAATLGAAAGREIRYVDLPPDQLRAGLVQAGLPDWYADDLVVLHQIFAAGWAADVSEDVERVAGRPPRTLAEFARENAAAFATG